MHLSIKKCYLDDIVLMIAKCTCMSSYYEQAASHEPTIHPLDLSQHQRLKIEHQILNSFKC